MTEDRGRKGLPVGHIACRVLLGIFVVSLIVTAVLLAPRWGGYELRMTRVIWGDARNWFLP
jgi:hypothetical protein